MASPSAWGQPPVHGLKINFPDCAILTALPSQTLDAIWYMPRPLETTELPGTRALLKIQLRLGLGACREINYSNYSPTQQKFYPIDAWPLSKEASIKNPQPFVLKATTFMELVENPVSEGDVTQNVMSLIADKTRLTNELKEKGQLHVDVDYLMTGLYLGYRFNKYKFIKLTYDFGLEADKKTIAISVHARR